MDGKSVDFDGNLDKTFGTGYHKNDRSPTEK
jgi:hypothetical protein